MVTDLPSSRRFLKKGFLKMESSVCIVGGCGHIGLPLGLAFAEVGVSVTLLDTDGARVRRVAAGQMPFLERGAEEILPNLLSTARLSVTTSPEVIRDHDIVVVTIGTPVDEFMDPNVRSFDRAIDRVLDQMRDGQLLILRSTVFPGVTNRLDRRAAERGLRIDIAHCPERIAQGFALEELTKLPQIVGGVTAAASQRSVALFSLLGASVIKLPPIEAELTKLFCNAFRYITFAISNQFYTIAENLGADFKRVRHAMIADYPRMAGFPAAGLAGGPCLLKDTMQLAAFNHNAFILGQAAMMVNEGLPSILVESVKAMYSMTGSTAAILGMAFKGNSDDPRDSLAYKLRKVLTLECRRVLCSDPYIDDPSFVSVETALKEADFVFLGACHDEYRNLVIAKPVIDIFGFLSQPGNAAVEKRSAA
jgi:UDP-N-acetyl-D-mannosaminuronic acid dehydrogenase